MKTHRQYEVIYKNIIDKHEHSWKCWSFNKEYARYQFEAKFENCKIKRINRL